MNIKLHSHPGSTFARRVRIYISERALDIPMEYVAMEKLSHKRKDYTKMNPYGKVPVLEVEGQFIYESMAIIDFLENIFPNDSLFPQDAILRAKTLMMIAMCDSEFATPVTPYFFARRFLPEEKWQIHGFGKALKKVKRHLKVLSEQLGENEFMLDNTFGLVEIAYAPFMEFYEYLDLEIPANLIAWYDNFKQKKSIQETKPKQ